jgi:hypothetical protein
MDRTTELLHKFLPGPGQIPEVDPADLKNLWTHNKSALERTFGRPDPFAYFLSAISGPVWYRLAQFEIMRQMINEAKGRVLPGMQDGKPTDAVFKAFAIVPMSGMCRGDPPHEWPPFDVDELFRLIEKEEIHNVR